MKSYSRRQMLASALASPVLAAPGWAGPSDIRRGGTLVATIGFAEPLAIFTPGGGGGSSSLPSSKVLQRLYIQRRDLSYRPVLAQSWSFDKSFQNFTLNLREGVTWHDGRPFIADDVAYSLTNYWSVVAPGGVLKVVDDVKVLEAHRLTVRFKRPVPQESVLADLHSGYVLPKHIYEGKDLFTNPANNAPIGTGPWKFKQWVHGSHAEFEPNDAYWIPGQPYLDKLYVRWWRDASSRAAALETGAADIGVSAPVPLGDLRRLQKDPNLRITWEDTGGCSAVIFNTRRTPFNNRLVRQAILHAIDRNLLVRTVYFGFGKPAAGPILASNKRYYNPDVPRYDFDPRKAAQLLDQAGFPKRGGLRFKATLVPAGESEEHQKVGVYLRQVLEDLGIRTTLRAVDRNQGYKLTYTDYDFDIAYSWGGGTSGEPVPALTQLYTAEGIAKGIVFRNCTGYTSPQMEAIVQKITFETDPAKRRQYVHEFSRLANTDVPQFPLVERPAYTVARANVHIPSDALAPWGDDWGNAWKG